MQVPPPAVGYCRVSREEQAREGVSLDAQRHRIQAYADAKGLNLAEVISDEGFSGKNLNRRALKTLLARCKRGEVGHVIVWKLDRLARRTKDLLTLVEDVFLAEGIELHSVSESLDSSTPHGRFVLTLLGGLAQMERELIGERTRGALAYKREMGQPTSHPPLGFKPNGKRHRMLQVPEELEIVRHILHLWQRGGNYARIASHLNSEGIPTKRGRRWHASTVKNVIQRKEWYREILGVL
jgi:DNA invertase Pin-like site-specific DNA recombinase